MQEDLNKMPELPKMCRAILNYICSQAEQNLRHITFGALSKAADLKNMQDIIPASNYLIGARVPLLTPRFEFIDDDFIEDIPLEEISQARDEGVFYHKGEIVSDFESKLFMYFTISPQGKELRNE